MGNNSLDPFVSFSINCLKENVQNLNYCSFWEETFSFICFCQLTVNEKVFVASGKCYQRAAMIEESVVYL